MLFRRVLAALRLCNIVSREWLQELGLTAGRIDDIVEKLVQDGIVQEDGQVDRGVLEEAVEKMFARRASKRPRYDDKEEVETMLRRATDRLHIGEVAGPSRDMRGGDGGGQGGVETEAGHVAQLAGGGDGGQDQRRERKRRRVSRKRGE
jgi:hypothetical protein